MREILYKGKRIDNGEWVEGFPFKVWDKSYILLGTHNDIPIMTEVITETIVQYVGITDKNGNKIFEGDICIYDSDIDGCIFEPLFHNVEIGNHNLGMEKGIFKTIFLNGGYSMEWIKKSAWLAKQTSPFQEIRELNKYIEIIDNIYDKKCILDDVWETIRATLK